jgi:hypothetical protein
MVINTIKPKLSSAFAKDPDGIYHHRLKYIDKSSRQAYEGTL